MEDGRGPVIEPRGVHGGVHSAPPLRRLSCTRLSPTDPPGRCAAGVQHSNLTLSLPLWASTMRPGLLAFAATSAFVGAALYINLVEQPARLALGPRSMVREWAPSNRRGFVMLASLAVISAISAYVDFTRTGDVRWLIGGTVILASWPYSYFVVVPVNIWLCAIPAATARSAVRELMRDWGLLEWGQTVIGFGAGCILAWALALPT